VGRGDSALDKNLDTAGTNIAAAMSTALDPDNLIIPIPPRPPGVATATIVEFSILSTSAVVAFARYFSWGR